MTAHTESRRTFYAFTVAVALFAALILVGLIIGTAMWPRTAAATTGPGIEIKALMSNVAAAKLPATEIAVFRR
jgi:hypothetical protein